jgi:hypothetical protein
MLNFCVDGHKIESRWVELLLLAKVNTSGGCCRYYYYIIIIIYVPSSVNSVIAIKQSAKCRFQAAQILLHTNNRAPDYGLPDRGVEVPSPEYGP